MASCIFVVGGIVQTAGVVIGMLYAGRLIAGFGVGFLTMIIPIYQAEITHRRIRGKVTSLQQLFNAVGQIFASWTDPGVGDDVPHARGGGCCSVVGGRPVGVVGGPGSGDRRVERRARVRAGR